VEKSRSDTRAGGTGGRTGGGSIVKLQFLVTPRKKGEMKIWRYQEDSDLKTKKKNSNQYLLNKGGGED